MVLTNHLEDPGKILVSQSSRKRCNCLKVGVSTRTIGRPTGWDDSQDWSGVMPTHTNGGRRVGRLVVAGKLLQDRDPDAGLKSDLVTDTDAFENGRELDRALVPEKAGVQLPDTLGSVDRAHLNVEHSLASGAVSDGVVHIDNVIINVRAVGVENQLDEVVDLLLGSLLPLTLTEVSREPLESQNRQPIFLRPVEHPVVELSVGGEPQLGPRRKVAVLTLEIGQAIVVTTNGFLHNPKLMVGGQLGDV